MSEARVSAQRILRLHHSHGTRLPTVLTPLLLARNYSKLRVFFQVRVFSKNTPKLRVFFERVFLVYFYSISP